MPSLKIKHCIVCDAARPELNNKFSLLGVFGIAPDAEIRVHKIDLPVDEITFVFLGSASETARVDVAVDIFDSSGATVFSNSQPTEVKAAELANLIYTIRLLKFPHVGRYTIRVRADGRPIYETTILISKGGPVA